MAGCGRAEPHNIVQVTLQIISLLSPISPISPMEPNPNNSFVSRFLLLWPLPFLLYLRYCIGIERRFLSSLVKIRSAAVKLKRRFLYILTLLFNNFEARSKKGTREKWGKNPFSMLYLKNGNFPQFPHFPLFRPGHNFESSLIKH